MEQNPIVADVTDFKGYRMQRRAGASADGSSGVAADRLCLILYISWMILWRDVPRF